MPDWTETPSGLECISDYAMRKFAHDLNGIWKNLCRRVKSEVSRFSDLERLLETISKRSYRTSLTSKTGVKNYELESLFQLPILLRRT